ncbi:MAG: glutamate--tRNA ligase [Actinomycetota bacterium]|nr:glutamate--tRNA ligase [Actinomycetota bacterium]
MIRVRFAPSPTGYFHVGGARTALYNWMLAKQSGGKFVLRIEDTDAERNKEEWVDGICNAMSWLGITWDEGPIRQSSRTQRHVEMALSLIEKGDAYYCDCRREDVEERNKASERTKQGYDGYCRERNLEKSPTTVLRYKVPADGSTTVNDLVRGEVVVANENIDDFVLLKANESPLFVLANVVDDIDMEISHVLRAEEHLPNTPKAVLLFKSFGKEAPLFAHVPVLVNEKRQKLSKRRDRVAVEDFKDKGFLPEAMINYLALLGWSPKDNREFMTLEEMTAEFSIEDVGHSPSFFDEKKMEHFNGVYIRALSDTDFVHLVLPFMEKSNWWEGSDENREKLFRLASITKERVSLLGQAPDLLMPIFAPSIVVDDTLFEKEVSPHSNLISQVAVLCQELDCFDAPSIEAMLRDLSATSEIPLRKLQAPIRVATTGAKAGLPLFELWEHTGRERIIERLIAASQNSNS